MPHSPSDDDRDFDLWLQQAKWPAGDAEQLPRLEAHWRRLQQAAVVVPTQPERRRRRGFALGVLAASLLALGGVGGWFATRPLPVVPPTIELASPIPAPNQQPIVGLPGTVPITAGGVLATIAPAVVRDPTPYEQAVLTIANARRKARREPLAASSVADVPVLGVPLRSPQRRATSQTQTTLETLVAELADNPEADVSSGLASLREARPRLEQRVWLLIEQGDATQRLGAVRLLAELGTSRSVALLERLAGEPALHEAAVLGLARLVNDRQLAWLADHEPDAKLNSALLGHLLQRSTAQSVGWYLRFVEQPRTQKGAFDAISSLQAPPVDLLFSFLESSQTAQRLAAAQALGRCQDPQIAQRLCATAMEGVARHEALIALLLQTSPQAEHCLQEARHDLYLVASVQAAEQHLHSLTPARGGNLQ